MDKAKKTLLITSLTSCNGCLFAILDLGQKFFEVLDNFELVDFHLIEDLKAKENTKIDIALVEGSVACREDKKKLESLRKKTRILIALGTCAHLGGVQRMKNYGKMKEIAKYVYPDTKKIDNIKIEPLASYVKVDFVIPGCPPNPEEILEILKQLAHNRKPYLPDRPVCFECQTKEYPCLLLEGKPCLGPLIRGGCEAICIKGGFECTGCRGLTREPNEEKMEKLLGMKEYGKIMEIFGNRKK